MTTDYSMDIFISGNFSCDCNRSKLMYDCKYEDMRECNLNDNTILIKIYDDNEVYYTEMENRDEEFDYFLSCIADLMSVGDISKFIRYTKNITQVLNQEAQEDDYYGL